MVEQEYTLVAKFKLLAMTLKLEERLLALIGLFNSCESFLVFTGGTLCGFKTNLLVPVCFRLLLSTRLQAC